MTDRESDTAGEPQTDAAGEPQTDPEPATENTAENMSEPATDTDTADSSRFADLDVARFRSLLDRAVLAFLLLLALIAALQFYLQASRAISIWVADDYEPVFEAAFNLALLFVAAAGIGYQLRRISRRGDPADAETAE